MKMIKKLKIRDFKETFQTKWSKDENLCKLKIETNKLKNEYNEKSNVFEKNINTFKKINDMQEKNYYWKDNKSKYIVNKLDEFNNTISEKDNINEINVLNKYNLDITKQIEIIKIKDNKIEELIHNGENNNNEKQLFNELKEKLNKSEMELKEMENIKIEFRNDK